MKFFNFLMVIPCLFYSVFSSAETENFFDEAYIIVKRDKHYRFEMNVSNNTNDKLNLYSTTVFRKTDHSFKAHPATPDNSIYNKVNIFAEGEETEDETVSLHLYLGEFTEYDKSKRFKKAYMEFREKFVPYSIPIQCAQLALDRNKVTDEKNRDMYLRRTVWLTSKYALTNPYKNMHIESEVLEQVVRTNNQIHDEELSQNLSITTNNLTFYSKSRKETYDALTLDSFYFGDTYSSITRNMHNSLWRNNQLNFAYTMYFYTNVFPLDVIATESYSKDSEEWPAYDSLENPHTGDSELSCVKKSEYKFTCYYSMANYAILKMPSSDEIGEHEYPKFLIENLRDREVTSEDLEKGVNSINLNALEYFAHR